MRRNEREITGRDELLAVLDRCFTCRVALFDCDYPYIVPMNYGVKSETDGGVTLYFHGASEGKKMDLLRQCPRVGFEVDRHEPYEAGSLTSKYESVVGVGELSVVTDAEEKDTAIRIITEHYEIAFTQVFAACMPQTTILKLTVKSMTGKRNL